MPTDFHLYRGDVATHWRQIAARIESAPSCLEVALDNIQRWMARGRLHPAPLMDWKQRIEAAQTSGEGMDRLLFFLREDNADAKPLKSCSPFVGI